MSWRLQLEDGLAADFDTNLSGLGTELGTGAYNMSEVLALPIFKQERLEEGSTLSFQCLLNAVASADSKASTSTNEASVSSDTSFQCILNAATSPATKVDEETLTYLNQGQSYELRLKKMGEQPEFNGKLFKSVVRVTFKDKRLQYAEQEQLEEWRTARPGERLIKIDVPLSYNLVEYHMNPHTLNTVEFLWDPKQVVGCFIQVHCISTEFTAKKHGGEKGVVFRITVDTYLHDDDCDQHMHSAACQVKVFKPKGADRKHKTDREKMEKRPDKDKYQPSYECTVLKECNLDSSLNNSAMVPQSPQSLGQSPLHAPDSPFSPAPVAAAAASPVKSTNGTTCNAVMSPMPTHIPSNSYSALPHHANIQQTQEWLKTNRFGAFCKLFQNFAGADLLRLGRDDLIQILGPADGIRLNNALQERHVRPRLTMYVCQEHEQVYHAMYLERPLENELKTKLAAMYNVNPQQISKILRQGPTGIRVLCTDEMVQNLTEESNFALQTVKDPEGDTYTIIMK
ncbi:transcription factor CP2-like isoform X2 [Amphiura filiformis]|uniref:transcription factor CP2-like isoform X2 n=1 Tax=Amphiura filiformis TaxID=82378 RepID=UPI003B21B35E